ncbi:hypothetical protein WH87_05040 [Devosia epidermidihirudinis]|uniref:Uncharacterized protein n=1 Tax=Devosia epidermidihirudinis TaxID=1293439 RepID=A0A0F5QHS8_9HYPH|nr:hypothetical protein [Devosia epidermidihirudinis]KKC39554.1 hypothetical protein WH87_05040 [Devosia epidermidihirudinis]
MAKLTKAQVKALTELRDDTRFGFRNANLGNRTAVALEKIGLVEWRSGRFFGGRYYITPAGRSALTKEKQDG